MASYIGFGIRSDTRNSNKIFFERNEKAYTEKGSGAIVTVLFKIE